MDDATWPEDAVHFPVELAPEPPLFILFISKSLSISQYYLLFDYDLFSAGNTLEEVFIGIRDYRYTETYNKFDSERWEAEDPCSECSNPEAYFPHYVHHPGHGNWCLAWKVPEPPEEIPTMSADFPKQIPVCR